jgi:hypothetical protein
MHAYQYKILLRLFAGNTYMPLHDHPYSDVNIIYSVVQTGERTTDRGTNSAPNIKRLGFLSFFIVKMENVGLSVDFH